jgi:hypothetical protein
MLDALDSKTGAVKKIKKKREAVQGEHPDGFWFEQQKGGKTVWC